MRDSAQALAGADNKRKYERVEIDLSASLVDDEGPARASVRNVARGGVFVATASPPAIGREVQVRFRMLATRMCEASGRVVWRSAGSEGAGFGIEFERTNHQMDCFLRSIVSLPVKLHPIYLADVLEPQITLI